MIGILRTYLPCFFLVFITVPEPVLSYELYDPSYEELFNKALQTVYEERYEEAHSLISEYIDNHPDAPEGYFSMAAMYSERMNTNHERSWMKYFKKFSELTIKKARKLIRSDKNNPRGYFYLGGMKGYMGLVEAQDRNYFSAFKLAIATKNNLEKALSLNPNLRDCYFGLGALYYFASKRHVDTGGLVGWIIKKFITNGRDMRSEGIRMLKTAIDNGGITASEAHNTLMWVMMCEKNYDEAYKLALQSLERYPKNKHSYWAKGRVELLRFDCKSANDSFNTIIGLILERKIPMKNFEDVKIAALIAEVCVNIPNWEPSKISRIIKNTRKRLNDPKIIHIEYQNAEQVLKELKITLNEIERHAFPSITGGGGDRHRLLKKR